MAPYIKRVDLKGFKSYKETGQYGSLSPGHNVIVGRNGSGKSNFFAAIKLILDAASITSKKELQSLQFEGDSDTGRTEVTLIIDNSDGSLPQEPTEIAITRTFTADKDSFSINGQVRTVNEVRELIELCGYPISTSYNIIEQDRVIRMAAMTPPERLGLLNELGSVRASDERREQSLKMVESSRKQYQETEEGFQEITRRIEALGVESKDLERFTELDQRRRAAEYILLQNELQQLGRDIEARRAQLAPLEQDASKRAASLVHCESQLSTVVSDIESTTVLVNELHRQLAQAEVAYNTARRHQTQAEITQQAAADRAGANETRARRAKQRAEELRSAIEQSEESISVLTQQRGAAVEEVTRLTTRISEIQAQLDTIADAGDGDLAVQDPDAWASGVNARLELSRREVTEAEATLASQQESLTSLGAELQALEVKLRDMESRRVQSEDDVTLARSELDRAQQADAQARREQVAASSIVQHAETSLASSQDSERSAESETFSKTAPAVAAGLQLAKRVCQEQHIQGVYGTVMEALGPVDAAYMQAVEAAAGNSLYHIIVQDDEVASRVLEAMRAAQGPDNRTRVSVTFKPLDQLTPHVISVTDDQAIPLVSLFPGAQQRVKPAIDAVFGRTYLVQDLLIGARLVKQYNIECVTPQGDIAGRHGEITGGVLVARGHMSRLQAMQLWRQARIGVAHAKEDYQKAKARADAATAEATRTSEALGAAESRLHTLIADQRGLIVQIKAAQADQQRQQDRYNRLQEQVSRTQNLIASQNSRVTQLTMALERGYQAATASASERQRLNTDLTALTEQLRTTETQASRLYTAIDIENGKLESNRQVLSEIQSQPFYDSLTASATSNLSAEAAGKEAEIAAVAASDAFNELSRIKDEHSKAADRLAELQRQREELLMRERQEQDTTDEAENSAQAARAALAEAEARRQERVAACQALGPCPPSNVLQEFEQLPITAIHQTLAQLGAQLRRLEETGVNHRAVHELQKLRGDSKDFEERITSLKSKIDTVDELIQSLNDQRNRVLHDNYEELSRNFSETFAKLSGGGRGEMFLVGGSGNVSEATGIGIRTNFSEDQALVDVRELSGGQRTLVALSLVFAMQATDPAPTCILDEVDAALDEAYRRNLSELIKERSGHMQILSTTFRPELLSSADEVWLVQHQHAVSQIRRTDVDNALRLVRSMNQSESRAQEPGN